MVVDEAPRARRARGIRCVDLDLDDVAGHDDRGARGRAGEDHVAGLEGEQLRQVGHQATEGEQQGVAGVLLHELPVHPGAHAQGGRVDRGRVDQVRSERREAVAALRAHVRSRVGGSQVVQAEVVRRGDGCHVLPAVVGGDAPRGLADDERDLALEGEQLGARGAFERLAGCRERRRGLEEVARLGRRSPPLRGARGVVEVHGDDLAGSDTGDGHGRPRLSVCEIIYDLA